MSSEVYNEADVSHQVWDIIADSFDKTRSRPWGLCLDFINSIPSSSCVVDLGCGNGRHLIPCAQRCRLTIGVDISKNLLRITQKKLIDKKVDNALLVRGNITNLPFKDNSADAVIYIATLHAIKGRVNRIRSLVELRRILKSDGRALISVWSRYQGRFLSRVIKNLFIREDGDEFGDTIVYWRQDHLDTPRFYHLYSKNEFIKDIKDAGLKILSIRPVRFHSRILYDNYFALVEKKDKG